MIPPRLTGEIAVLTRPFCAIEILRVDILV